ncbi:NUDIX domain-containing protein [Ancylobacter sp. Lp-2]|uniref:NUDIX hydrolase n=1 Tax=Ancylobacter sp. Lp-2 TaxID=2881339 RepID=UPI001E5401DD|nr:NUDIX domain-containing protein [Ancylobacter sp. Lp-2]MCB4770433.1 NUDIX domain-containing protein [Ancylobacter sp. Lp-2]
MAEALRSRVHIAAGVLRRADGHVALVRKRGTSAFIQPGGKIEPGETALAALKRELREELGLSLGDDEAVPLGRFSAPAVNEPGAVVVADVFLVDTTAELLPDAEIEEVIWIDPSAPGDVPLAPLTRDWILPAL